MTWNKVNKLFLGVLVTVIAIVPINVQARAQAIVQNKMTQDNITPKLALEMLINGNKRFTSEISTKKNYKHQISQTAKGQHPFAIVLSCMDSRVPVEIIFDQGIGDIFSARIAGNFANTDLIGSIEYATKMAGSKLILVLGHTDCGSIKAAIDSVEQGNITSMLNNISPAVDIATRDFKDDIESSNEELVNKTTVANVKNVMEIIIAQSEIINQLIQAKKVLLVGGIYDVKTGKVEIF